MFNGVGKYTYYSGDVYIGEFKDGKKDGDNCQYKKNKDVYVG